MRGRSLPVLGLALLGLGTATAALATSYVPVSDENLVAQAAVVVVVRARSAGPAATGSRPATDYRMEIERVLKGSLPGSNLQVRVEGGVRADGIGLKIWGAPSFAPGERALLFLSPELDGSWSLHSWSIVHMMLGAFHEVEAGGRRWAVRDLSEAQALTPEGKATSAADTARDFARFADWIAARARGVAAAADYRAPRAAGIAPPQMAEKFTLLRDPTTNLPLRWFDFEAGNIEAAGRCGIPASAVALSLNLTVVNPTGTGHLTLYPAGLGLLPTSSVNFGPQQIRSSNTVLKVSVDAFAALNARASVQGAGTVDLIVDVNGYFQ